MAEIFLSYARADNEDPDGWVLQFHEQLKKRLGSILGEEVSVFLDQYDFKGNLLREQILSEIKQAEILVTLLSPWYLKRDWCHEERTEFIRHLSQRFPNANPEERIFVAIKRLLFGHKQVDKDFINKLPAEFRGQLFFNFFSLDKNNNLTHLDPKCEEFDTALNNLANKLVHIWTALKDQQVKRYVYVAETTKDSEASRANIIKELESHGFVVFPPTYLSESKAEAEAQLDVYLKDCELSIHLLGKNYGLVMPESNESLNEMQYQRAKSKGLPMLIWVPKGLVPADERQKSFIDNVRKSVSETSDLIEGSLQDFLAEVSTKLKEGANK
jgi:hypothetical protein